MSCFGAPWSGPHVGGSGARRTAVVEEQTAALPVPAASLRSPSTVRCKIGTALVLPRIEAWLRRRPSCDCGTASAASRLVAQAGKALRRGRARPARRRSPARWCGRSARRAAAAPRCRASRPLRSAKARTAASIAVRRPVGDAPSSSGSSAAEHRRAPRRQQRGRLLVERSGRSAQMKRAVDQLDQGLGALLQPRHARQAACARSCRRRACRRGVAAGRYAAASSPARRAARRRRGADVVAVEVLELGEVEARRRAADMRRGRTSRSSRSVEKISSSPWLQPSRAR